MGKKCSSNVVTKSNALKMFIGNAFCIFFMTEDMYTFSRSENNEPMISVKGKQLKRN
jgi:hypothetical protein